MPRQIIIRTSERRSLKRCPAQWDWAWRKGLEPNATDTKLWVGQGIHLALAEWYKPGFVRGDVPAKTWLKFVGDEARYVRDNKGIIDDQTWVDARDLVAHMLLNYVENYGDDSNWDVIATEQSFEVVIRLSNGQTIIYTGTFDGVYRDRMTGKLWLMEHKSAASIPSTGYLELDDQAGSYFAFAEPVLKSKGIMHDDEHLEGIMYNFLRKAMPDDRPQDENGRFLNKDGTVSKRQGTPLFMRHPVWRSPKQRVKMVNNIIAEAELMQAYRTKQLSITKTPTMDCSWSCPFFQMCQLHEQGEDWEMFRDAMFHRRDPYADHRLALKSASI